MPDASALTLATSLVSTKSQVIDHIEIDGAEARLSSASIYTWRFHLSRCSVLRDDFCRDRAILC